MSPREDAASKARRLLAEGRVYVQLVNAEETVALCRGDSAEVYSVRHDPDGWSCSCVARTVNCSHIKAVQLVTLAGQRMQVEPC